MVLINNVRSERSVADHFRKSACSDLAGPGRYEHERSGDWHADEVNVPFQSNSDRVNMGRMHSTIVTPGPGTYSLRRSTSSPCCTARHIPTGRGAFRSRTAQISPISHCPGATEFMASSIKDNPGPGEYSIAGDIAQPHQVKKDSNHGLSSISYSKSMPSMPPKRDPKLVRFSGRNTDRPGPSDTENGLPEQVRRTASATNFHTSPTQRSLFEHNASIDNYMPPGLQPGPGEYQTSGQLQRGPSSPFKSLTPQVPLKVKDGPGPGTYYWQDESEDVAEEKPLPSSHFRSSSGRGQSWQLLSHPYTHPDYVYKVPGPGKYPNAPGFMGGTTRRARHSSNTMERKFHGVHQPQQMMSLRDTDGLKLWGFDSSDDRSCNKPDKDNGVPSLAYNIEESMGQSLKSNLREPAKIGRKGPFGSGGDRFHGFALSPPRGECPGPGEHQNLEKRDGFYSLKGEMSKRGFRSNLPRFPRDPASSSQQPSPGTYEAFDKVNYRNKFRRAKVQHLSFGSGGSRWSPNEVFVGQKHIPNPGPGEYSPRHSEGNVALGNIGSTNRDLSALPRTGSTPGPGQYHTHGTTMHLMTYNVSGPEAARRAQGCLQSVMEPPNIGGGAGGGITGTRSRLGHCPVGGSGQTAAAIDAVVRERGAKTKKESPGSQSQSALSSPKGALTAAREDNTSPSMKEAVGMTFVTEPIGLAKGWSLGKANSPVQQATSQPDFEQSEQQSGKNTTSDQPAPERAVETVVIAENEQARVLANSEESAVENTKVETAITGESNVVTTTGDTVEKNEVQVVETTNVTDTETVVVAVETSE